MFICGRHIRIWHQIDWLKGAAVAFQVPRLRSLRIERPDEQLRSSIEQGIDCRECQPGAGDVELRELAEADRPVACDLDAEALHLERRLDRLEDVGLVIDDEDGRARHVIWTLPDASCDLTNVPKAFRFRA